MLSTSVTACIIHKNTFSAPFGIFYVKTEIWKKDFKKKILYNHLLGCSYLATWWDIGFHFPYLKGTFFKNLHFNGTVPFTLIRCEHLQIDTEFSFFVCLFFPYFPFRSVYTKNHKKYFVPFKNVFLSPNKRCWFCLFGKTVCLVRFSVWVYRESVWVVCWEYL